MIARRSLLIFPERCCDIDVCSAFARRRQILPRQKKKKKEEKKEKGITKIYAIRLRTRKRDHEDEISAVPDTSFPRIFSPRRDIKGIEIEKCVPFI